MRFRFTVAVILAFSFSTSSAISGENGAFGNFDTGILCADTAKQIDIIGELAALTAEVVDGDYIEVRNKYESFKRGYAENFNRLAVVSGPEVLKVLYANSEFLLLQDTLNDVDKLREIRKYPFARMKAELIRIKSQTAERSLQLLAACRIDFHDKGFVN